VCVCVGCACVRVCICNLQSHDTDIGMLRYAVHAAFMNSGPHGSMDTAPAYGAGDSGFESRCGLRESQYSLAAEHLLCKQKVPGSIPGVGCVGDQFGWCSWLSRLLNTQKVASSILASNIFFAGAKVTHRSILLHIYFLPSQISMHLYIAAYPTDAHKT
jgi:hypothetical protein